MEREPDRQAEGRGGREAGAGVALYRPMLAAFVTVLLLFAVFEVVEKLWLDGVEDGLLQLLHRVRAGAAALVTIGVASWLLLREGPPLLAAGPLPGEHVGESGIDPAQKRLHFARWLIVMRWIAVMVAAVGIAAAVEVAGLLPRHVGPALGAIIAWLMLLNLGYSVYLRQCGASTALLAVQVYVDVVVLILLLHFSGGIENPLAPLLLLHVIIAGIVLGRAHSYLVAGFCSVLFGLLAWGELTGVLPHYTLRLFPHVHVDGIIVHASHDPLYAASRVALQALMLLLVAYFTTTLVERIRRDERQLEALADRALAQAQTLERALDTTGTALCLCDREFQPHWANTRWAEWLAAAPELSCQAGVHGAAAGSTLLDGRVRQDEIRAHSGDGHARVFHLTTAPLRDRDDRISHVVTLARDVTEQHEAQARTVRAERLAAVGELAGQVAHEVNNPIAIISAKARLLLRDTTGALPAKVSQEITKIAELSDRVARIAQGLLSYCRPAPGARMPLDVRLPVRRALAYVDARAADQGVRLSDELPERMPAVHANVAELEQVFLNLFLNALDAMPDGGVLSVRGQADPEAAAGAVVAVLVSDTGHGISEAIRERVFEPFLTTKGGQGSGLGLSICQGLVRSHGGEITIVSEAAGGAGSGTRVRVSLPASTPAATASPVAAAAAAAAPLLAGPGAALAAGAGAGEEMADA
jgi:signal transduction histidine kinase